MTHRKGGAKLNNVGGFGAALRARIGRRPAEPLAPPGFVEIEDAVDRLRPHRFRSDFEAPLTPMESALLNGGAPGTSTVSPMLPGGLSHISNAELTRNPLARADFDAVHRRAYRIKVQEDSCRQWLLDQGIVREMQDGREVVEERVLPSASVVSRALEIDHRPVPSNPALRRWMKDRIDTWPDHLPAPTEGEDLIAATAYFGARLSRDDFREFRRTETPRAWRQQGKRVEWGRAKQSAANPRNGGTQN